MSKQTQEEVKTGLLWVGGDSETHLIAAEKLAPPIVCITSAIDDEQAHALGCEMTQIAAIADGNMADGMSKIEYLARQLFAPGICSIWHNFAYDGAVIVANMPALMPIVFQALAEGRVKCTRIREKLLAVTTTGNIDYVERDGQPTVKAEYSLAALMRNRFGIDIRAQKTASDAWRTNYEAIADMPSDKWPKEAVSYAIEDSVFALDIARDQERDREKIMAERGIDPFKTEAFQVGVDFCLRLMSCWGMRVDHEYRDRLASMLATELDPAKHSLLIDSGILVPGEPPRPHKKQPGKMVKGVPEKVSMTKLRAFVQKLAEQFPEDVKIVRTEKSEKFPDGQISVGAEWLDDHSHLSPVLEQYAHRQSLQKLVTTEIPRMSVRDRQGNVIGNATYVHPLYDVLKRTGRTSSFGDDMVPSFNCQNVHSGIRNDKGEVVMDVRGCFIPREGTLLFSIDYSYMELCTLAQKCLELFGESQLAKIINAGHDPHAWLGSQLCFQLDPDFPKLMQDSGIEPTPDTIFDTFMKTQKCGVPEWEKNFKHWRKMAKPTGLGYPGGLGPKTFIKYAKATFGVIVTLEEATRLRDAWRAALPEMPKYFEWINNCCPDPWNKVRTKEWTDPETGEKKSREVEVYAYTSPMGMYRAGCDYCAAANGAGLQTPSAEGAKLAVWTVCRAAFDPAMENPIYGNVHPICFVHDEIIGEVVDNSYRARYLSLTADMMVEAFRQATPLINVKAQPVLMRRWNKEAEPVFDANGELTVWEPKKK